VKALLDTHTLVWLVDGSNLAAHLSTEILGTLENPDTELFVSAATAWEMSIKYRAGKWSTILPLLQSYAATLSTLRVTELLINSSDGIAAAQFASPHRDPFDRMIAQHARSHDLTLFTRDRAFETLGVPVEWV
jgi:PIN domain nuclease of toxin-antitoxin system